MESSEKKIKVGITGASGHSGVELVKILSAHPMVELAKVTSRSLAGQAVVDSMPGLAHLLGADFKFSASDPKAQAEDADIDVWFLALPHGVAAEYAKELIAAGKTVIDLSADFRLGSLERYKEFYKVDHPAPELLRMGRYVIPEILPPQRGDKLIACAGCYPTSIQIPLTPLYRAGLLSTEHVVIDSYSGVSGGGKKADLFYAYCERNESARGYGMPKHRHLSEIEEQLGIAAGREFFVQFNPHLAPMTRGISTTITVPAAAGASIEKLYDVWNKEYALRRFVRILPSGVFADTLLVNGTNRCDISAVHDSRTGNFVITSAIDNLVKGASGQAVQIMNILLGFDEACGLL